MMETALAASSGFQAFSHKLGCSVTRAGSADERCGSSKSQVVPWRANCCFAAAPPSLIRMQGMPSAGDRRWLTSNLSGLQSSSQLVVPTHGRRLDKLESSMWGRAVVVVPQESFGFRKVGREMKCLQVQAKAGESAVQSRTKMNLHQYAVTLDHPTGIRFAQTLSGKIYVDALAKNGNADRARIIMVGDVLKKISAVSGDAMCEVQDFRHTMKTIKARDGQVNLILERSSPFFRASISNSSAVPFNVGRVPVSTWNNNNLASPYQPSDGEDGGNVGFVTYSSTFVTPKALRGLTNLPGVKRVDNLDGGPSYRGFKGPSPGLSFGDEESFEVIGSYADEDTPNVEWTHGNYNEQEYVGALKRAESDLSYNPALGMNYSKILETVNTDKVVFNFGKTSEFCQFELDFGFQITEQIYVGSCIQEENDVHQLVDRLGVTAVLNLQRRSEQDNWGIDGEAIEKLAHEKGLVVVNCPIREVDAVDLRRKLPFAVGVLYRLLRKGYRVYVTCTSGLDRSPACVIAYLHWIQDVALQEAVDYIKRLHPCGPDRPALVWATWDLIALAENEDHKGPPTHAIQFVWNHGCNHGEEVLLVGEFKGGWNEPIKAVHASGPKYTVDLRLPQGKYNYKFIVGGNWRHSNSLPTEGDRWGNINNVIKIGDVATPKFDTPHRAHVKDLNSIKVIERPLTEDERYTLAFAARRLAFAINPFAFAAKK